jgi:7-cyano-7-deazaguanine synthase
MDSSTLLLNLLAEGYNVTAVSFDYGQKHKMELERAKELVMYLNQQSGPNALIKPITHQVITLDGLSQLLNSSLVTGGEEVPEGHYAEENMKATVVPNRNKIFSSIIQSVALSIAEQKGTNCAIAMGIHAGDHAIYPDCRQEFRDIDFEAFKMGVPKSLDEGEVKRLYYTIRNSMNIEEDYNLWEISPKLDYKNLREEYVKNNIFSSQTRLFFLCTKEVYK